MKTTRKCSRFLMVVVCLFTMLFFSAIVFADEIETGVFDREILTVGISTDRCPVFYIDKGSNEPVGIGVDLMKVIAEQAGYDVEFRVIGEENLKAALDNPEYDVVMPFGSAIDSAAGNASIVTDNLMQTPFTLVTRKEKLLPSLNSIKVGMLHSLSGVAETVKQLFPGMEIVFFNTMDESVKALRRGEIDALLHNSFVWSYVLQKPAYDDLAVKPSTIFSMDFRVGTLDTPEGHRVIERLNGAIAVVPDTAKQGIIVDYTTRHLYHYDIFDYIYEYGRIMLMIALLIIAVIVIAWQRYYAFKLEQEQKMLEYLDHDPLTGTLSINGFRKRVVELLRKYPDTQYFLSYNNIKNFKYINERFGKSAGDDLLKFWADKSREVLTDKEAICRIESDHFVVLRCAGGDEQLSKDGSDVMDQVRNYFIDRHKDSKVRICSGIYVLTPEDYQTPDVDHMIDFARVTEKRVSENLKDSYGFYNPEQWKKGMRTADIIGNLPLAITSGEIQVWYQPQINYETREIAGAEALCRWNHKKLGFISPGEFIPILEESGLIYDLDCFIWERVCRDLERWNRQGIHRSVSVNVARCDIKEEYDIPNHFRNLLKTYELTPDQLRIEITESAYADNSDIIIDVTKKLQEYGFEVEMDDFGSGYSTLNMLKDIPVDRVKLDYYFLTKSGDLEKGNIIVSYIIRMVRDLGMKLIAEGIEDVSQAEFLTKNGCSYMQGYYFGKPMPVQEFEALDI